MPRNNNNISYVLNSTKIMTALHTTRSLLVALMLCVGGICFGQTKNSAYMQYINTYKDLAIDQMHKHSIPASITLAQALLESGAGQSELARKSNNHFGIKVSTGWTGPYVKADDDRKGEHFRKYSSVAQSYEDHSQFLLKQRYRPLFQLDPLDYKAWARGLKACGYATNPAYANLLINIIDLYELHDYDEDRFGNRVKPKKKEQVVEQYVNHKIIKVNNLDCIVARPGDTWEIIAKETKINKRKLLSFNEASKEMAIVPGTNIFLHKKAKKAEKKYAGFWHKIKKGESLYDISQQYGIRVKYIYKLNYKDADYIPIPGDIIRIR